MKVINMLLNLSMASIVVVGMINPSIALEREKKEDTKGKQIGQNDAFKQARSVFEQKGQNTPSPAVLKAPAKPLPPTPPQKPIVHMAKPAESPSLQPRMTASQPPHPYGVEKTLSHDLLERIFNAPFVTSNKPAGTTIALMGEVAGKVEGPNDTLISHKFEYLKRTTILQMLKDHPTSEAVLSKDEPAGMSTFGDGYHSTLAEYYLYENGKLIPSSKIIITISKRK